MRRLFWATVAVILFAATFGIVHSTLIGAWAVPEKLTDQQFWKLITDSSEPGGYFRNSDVTNLTSNELLYQRVLTDLLNRTKPGGVYLGVGPEQNYTYMAALKPRMAIIFDIRRGNLDIQLMYKAIFELSRDRSDFVSMLFSKQHVAGLNRTSSASQLFDAYAKSSAVNQASFTKNLAAINDWLTKTHAFPLLASRPRSHCGHLSDVPRDGFRGTTRLPVTTS